MITSALLLSSCSFAADDENEYQDFDPTDFVYYYGDHNSTTYEGDSGLVYVYVNNSIDNQTYVMATEFYRGFAYATGGTLKTDEPILAKISDFTGSNGYYTVVPKKFKNGTIIPYLGIEYDNLTNEQKKYFDDYNTQRSEYLMQQQEFAQENLYDYYSTRSKSNSKSKYSYYAGTGGSGIIYTP